MLGPQLREFVRRGWEVVGASAPGPYVAEIESWGVRHEPLRHAVRSWSLSDDLLAMRELYALFRRLRPAVVHTHNPKPGIYGRIAARLAGVPVIVNTVHGLYATPDDPAAKRAVVYAVERLASTCSQAELVQNPEDMATLARIGVPLSKLSLLGNGVDLARFDPARVDRPTVERLRREMGASGPEDVVVGAVGRLVWEKGYRELFAAAARWAISDANIKVVVVGPDDTGKSDAVDRASMVAAEQSGVRFLGARRDVEAVYAALDVYVLASHREGFPRSAMEAAAMGVPVIATDIRGCRQVVDPGHTGLLFPRGDVESLVEAVHKVVRDPDLRRTMGEEGRRKALREFDQRRVIELTLSTYERLGR